MNHELDFATKHPVLYAIGGTFMLTFLMGLIAFMLSVSVTGF